MRRSAVLMLAVSAFAATSGAAPAPVPKSPDGIPPAAAGKMDFVNDIQPIIAKHCLRCHFSPRPSMSYHASDRGGFSLSTRARAMKGGHDIGVVIVPGRGAISPLVRLVSGLPDEKAHVRAMPPFKGGGLSKQEVGKLRAWIDQGVAWPE